MTVLATKATSDMLRLKIAVNEKRRAIDHVEEATTLTASLIMKTKTYAGKKNHG